MSVSKLVDDVEYVSLDGGREYNFVKLDEKAIDKLKLIFANNNSLILWIETDGLHKFKKHLSQSHLDILKQLQVSSILLQGSRSLTNVDGIYSQKNLLELDTTNFQSLNLDFSYFKNLVELAVFWTAKHKALFDLIKLERLSLWKYKSKSLDLEEFANFRELGSLRLVQSNITSLSGIENLENLKKIRLAYNSKLEFNPKFSMPQVEELSIHSCKMLNFEYINIFPNLKSLRIENHGEIESLRPILEGLPKLEQFSIFGAKIKESDNRYWLDYKNIKEFRFQDMRHFILKSRDF